MQKNRMKFEDLEKIIMEKFSQDNKSIKDALIKQYEKATIIKKVFTGHGFFTYFNIPDNIPKIKWSENSLDTSFCTKINNELTDFILFLNNGKISSLEGFGYENPWWPDIKINYQCSPTSAPSNEQLINSKLKTVSFEDFTKIIIEKLAETNKYFKDKILQQFNKAKMGTRTFTGKKFFTQFNVPDNIETINASVIESNKIDVKIDGKNTDYVLFLENGKIHTLAGVVCDGPWWPEITVNCNFEE